MKGQKKEILTKRESRLSNQPYAFYFLPTTQSLKQLPTHIAHIAKAPQANTNTKALSKSAILPKSNFAKMNRIDTFDFFYDWN